MHFVLCYLWSYEYFLLLLLHILEKKYQPRFFNIPLSFMRRCDMKTFQMLAGFSNHDYVLCAEITFLNISRSILSHCC